MSTYQKLKSESKNHCRTNLLLLVERENSEYLELSHTNINSIHPKEIMKKYELLIEIKNPAISSYTPNSFHTHIITNENNNKIKGNHLTYKNSDYLMNAINKRKIGIASKKFDHEKVRRKNSHISDEQQIDKSTIIHKKEFNIKSKNFMDEAEIQIRSIQNKFDYLQNLAFSLKCPKPKNSKSILKTLKGSSKKKVFRCNSENKIMSDLKFNDGLLEILEFKDINLNYKKFQKKTTSFKLVDTQLNSNKITPSGLKKTYKNLETKQNSLIRNLNINFEPGKIENPKLKSKFHTEKVERDLEIFKFDESPKKSFNYEVKPEYSLKISQISPIHEIRNEGNTNSQKQRILKDQNSHNLSDFDICNLNTPQNNFINNQSISNDNFGSGQISSKSNFKLFPTYFELNKNESVLNNYHMNKSNDIIIISDKSNDEIRSIVSCDVKYLSSVTENSDSKMNESVSYVSKITVDY